MSERRHEQKVKDVGVDNDYLCIELLSGLRLMGPLRTNPVYRDPDAARAFGHPDVIAPPTFGIVLSMTAGRQVIADPELGLDYSRVVHGEQRFVIDRPIRAGDRLTVTVTVENIRSAAGNDMITTRGDVTTVDGEPVFTAYSTLVARGTAGG